MPGSRVSVDPPFSSRGTFALRGPLAMSRVSLVATNQDATGI